MARPLRIQYSGAFYHVTCRGNERRKIFLDNDDRSLFLKLLAESLDTYQVLLYSYVMMSNHFHLVVQTLRANLSEFMRRFNICYTGWFNHHHGRCGHLYQGRYKALLVDADSYLLELSRYIHLNPIRVERFRKCDYNEQWQYVRQYPWSSLPGYLNEKWAVGYVDYGMVLEMVGGHHKYSLFLLDGLKEGLQNPFEDVQYQVILGGDDFVAQVKSNYIVKGSLREQPMYRDMTAIDLQPEMVIKAVIRVLKVSRKDLYGRYGNGVVRGIISELLYRYCGITQQEIGRLLGIDYSSVNKLRGRLKKRMAHDRAIAAQYKRIVKRINK